MTITIEDKIADRVSLGAIGDAGAEMLADALRAVLEIVDRQKPIRCPMWETVLRRALEGKPALDPKLTGYAEGWEHGSVDRAALLRNEIRQAVDKALGDPYGDGT